MKNDKIIIHIGLSKTATTSLQGLLLLKLHNERLINYLGRGFVTKELRIRDREMLMHFLGRGVFPDPSVKKGMVSVYSDESLSNPGDYFQRAFALKCNGKSIADQLYATFSKTFSSQKIIVVLRAQKTMIRSFYSELYYYYAQDNNTNTLEKFLWYVFNNKDKFDTWYYSEMLEMYTKIFGEENISVLLFEDLKNDKPNYYSQWAGILGVSYEMVMQNFSKKELNVKKEVKEGKQREYKKVTAIGRVWIFIRNTTGLIKIIEKNRDKWDNNPLRKAFEKLLVEKRRVKIIRKFTEEEKEMVIGHFKESNSNLVGRFGLEEDKLKKYGYI